MFRLSIFIFLFLIFSFPAHADTKYSDGDLGTQPKDDSGWVLDGIVKKTYSLAGGDVFYTKTSNIENHKTDKSKSDSGWGDDGYVKSKTRKKWGREYKLIYGDPKPASPSSSGWFGNGADFLSKDMGSLILLILGGLLLYLKPWEIFLVGWRYGKSTYAEEFYILEQQQLDDEPVSKLDWIAVFGRSFKTGMESTIGETPLGQKPSK